MKLLSASTFPTRREVLLVVCLLVLLLFFADNSRWRTSDGVLGGTGVVDEYGAPILPDEEGTTQVAHSTQFASAFPYSRFTWADEVPQTTIVAHAYGWTIFDRLYAFDGAIIIVTSNPEEVPPLDHIYSTGYGVYHGEENYRMRKPTDKDIRVLTPRQAQELFQSKQATYIDGANFLVNDPKQFITHYYHWVAELFFGIWRAYSALDPGITADGHTTLPPPRRIIFTHTNSSNWRDYAAMNQWVTRSAIPSITFEYEDDWADRAAMHTPFVFERVVVGDRAAAEEGPHFKTTWRSASEAFSLRGSPHWWDPVRVNVLTFAGLAPEWIYGPAPGSAAADAEKFVITYVSRQNWGRRMLIQEDHEKLVEELYKLRDRYGYEVNVVSMDKLTRAEQFQLAGRTTVMMGVHGNGLTSLVWMRPTPRSTVIEFFYPEGLAFDYEWTTRALGMVHFGVWYNKTFTRPNTPRWPNYPEGFQGNAIPLDGTVVARLVHRRITQEEEVDHEYPII